MNLEIWWLKTKRKRTAKAYAKLIMKAANREEEESLISEAMNERDLIDDKILHLRSMDVQEKALDTGIPVPPHSDKAAWPSVETTERYLGCKQRLSHAVNDSLGLEDT